MDHIQLSALARDVEVGNLYNYHTDGIFPGRVEIPKEWIHITKEPNGKIEKSFIFQHQPFKLGINSHIQNSMQKGYLDINALWFAEYLEKSKKNEAQVAKVDIYFRIARKTAKLDDSFRESKLNEYQLTAVGRTHLVEQVVYGAEYIFSMRQHLDTVRESKENVQGIIYAAAQTYFDEAFSSDNIELPAELSKVKCTVYNSLSTDTPINNTFSKSFQWLRDSFNKEQPWRPIEIFLWYIPEQLETRLYNESIADSKLYDQQNEDAWRWIIDQNRLLSTDPCLKRIPPLAKLLNHTGSFLSSLLSSLKSHYAKLYPRGNSVIEISKFLDKLTKWFALRRQEIERFSDFFQDTVEVPMRKFADIKKAILTNGQKCSKVFILKIGYREDCLLEDIKSFIKHPEEALKTLKLPVFSLLGMEDENYKKIHKKMRKFASDAYINPEISYYIGLIPTSSLLTDGMIETLKISDLKANSTNHKQGDKKSRIEQRSINKPTALDTQQNEGRVSLPLVNVRLPILSPKELIYEDIVGAHLSDPLEISVIEQKKMKEEKFSQQNNDGASTPCVVGLQSYNPSENSVIEPEKVKDEKFPRENDGSTLALLTNVKPPKRLPKSLYDEDVASQQSGNYLEISLPVIEQKKVGEESVTEDLPVKFKMERNSDEKPKDAESESPPLKRKRYSSVNQPHLSEEQVDTLKNLPGSIGEKFANEISKLSQLIAQGQPNVYMLNSKEVTIDADLRSFHIGRHSLVPNHKVIILMGATGCGKSTLINGMVNYILGVQWKDPFRFKCVREDESLARNQALSQTSSVTAYTIHHHEGMAVPYSITIIDTPGYGDTRGVARDKEITQLIHRFLGQEASPVKQIHAACFVAASGDSRLTVTQSYILDSVLSIFGKDVKDNIRLLVTFADNADPPVVEACRVGNFPLTSPSAGITYSKFNSSVLYASNKQEEDEDSFDELFWDMGQENYVKFFTMLDGMDGCDLASTRQVIQGRQLLEQSLTDIESELEVCFLKIEEIEKFRRELVNEANQKKNNTDSTIEEPCVRLHRVHSITLYFNCRRCKTTCGPLNNVSRFKTSCLNPKCYCPPSVHGFDNFRWCQETIHVESTLQHAEAEDGKMTNKKLLDKCTQDLKTTKTKMLNLLRQQVGSSIRCLESTALRSSVLSSVDYLTLMRSRFAEEQKPGYLIRLNTLAELQQTLNSDSETREHHSTQTSNSCSHGCRNVSSESQRPEQPSGSQHLGESSGISTTIEIDVETVSSGQLPSDDENTESKPMMQPESKKGWLGRINSFFKSN